MRLSKAAREKLTKEADLYEQTCYFILSFGLIDVLRGAYKKIYSVFHDLDVILSSSSSPVDDVSLMIDENRSKVENELIYICDNAYNIKTRQAFKDFLVHFKQGDVTKYRSNAYCYRYGPNDIISSNSKAGTRKKGKEIAPHLTKLESKQQKDDDDDDEKHQVYMEKLKKESNDYDLTLRFMASFLNTEKVTNDEQRKLLVCAYKNVMSVYIDVQYYITSNEVLCDKDVSLILNRYRSKVKNELQGICDNVSNITVQEVYTRHLAAFETGFPQGHLSHLQNEDVKIMSSKPKMSVKEKKKKSKLRLRGKGGSGSCKTPPLIDLHMMNEYLHGPFRDHSKCCMNNHLDEFASGWDTPLIITKEEGYPSLVDMFSDDDSS